jgi:hypothetical protein
MDMQPNPQATSPADSPAAEGTSLHGRPDFAALTPYRRAVEVAVEGGNLATAEMEDDHHHFRVEMESEDGRIVRVRGTAIRNPWTLCALAADELQRLVGAPITPDPTAVLAYANIRHQCTHMFDLAGLAVAALGRAMPAFRRYEMTVAQMAENLWQAELLRSDGYALGWMVRLGEIAAPSELEGKSLKAPFAEWASAYFDSDGFEAALVLRRSIFVGKFRHKHDLDLRANAGEGSNNIGACFVMQPERAGHAARNKGATTSFPPAGPGPLSHTGRPARGKGSTV